MEDAKRYNRKWVIVSIDLSKAYDTVNFYLLERVLREYEVAEHTPLGKGRRLIRFMKGLKQGDGLSPQT